MAAPNRKRFLEKREPLFEELAQKFPTAAYTSFCGQLGVGYDENQAILKKHKQDSRESVKEVLWQWSSKEGASREGLEKALKDANIGGTGLPIVANHCNGGPGPGGDAVTMATQGASPSMVVSSAAGQRGKRFLEKREPLFEELAQKFPTAAYTSFCGQLGVGYNENQAILKRHKQDSRESVKEVLWQWSSKEGASREGLEKALKNADIGGFGLRVVAKHCDGGAERNAVASGEGARPVQNLPAPVHVSGQPLPVRQPARGRGAQGIQEAVRGAEEEEELIEPTDNEQVSSDAVNDVLQQGGSSAIVPVGMPSTQGGASRAVSSVGAGEVAGGGSSTAVNNVMPQPAGGASFTYEKTKVTKEGDKVEEDKWKLTGHNIDKTSLAMILMVAAVAVGVGFLWFKAKQK